jgi:hypothetical protein
MPLSPNFNASQTVGLPSVINFLDTSTGSDSNITGRRVYFQTSSGSFLVESGTSTDYELWPLTSGTSISYTVLTKDYALLITVEWIDVNGDALYSSQQLIGFTLYNETFDYQLTQVLSGNPLRINDNQFFEQKSKLRDCIDSGNQALTLASDIVAAQQCYKIATDIRLSSQYIFNINS